MSALDDLITQHSNLTRELVQQLRELGDLKARVLTDQAHAWATGRALGVTERREAVKYATVDIEAEVINQVYEVEALRAEIEDTALRIKYTAQPTWDVAWKEAHGGA